MTPDILITRLSNLQTELIGLKTAQEALMIALPAEQQESWIQALHFLRSTRGALLQALAAQGADATALQAQLDAIGSRIVALEHARRGVLKAGGAAPG